MVSHHIHVCIHTYTHGYIIHTYILSTLLVVWFPETGVAWPLLPRYCSCQRNKLCPRGGVCAVATSRETCRVRSRIGVTRPAPCSRIADAKGQLLNKSQDSLSVVPQDPPSISPSGNASQLPQAGCLLRSLWSLFRAWWHLHQVQGRPQSFT